jgi:NADH:ubiquinone oxidoreductase subunit 4 (subunit M)
VLAAYALKFATVGFLAFAATSVVKFDTVNGILIFSIMFATLGMAATCDVKKLIANFSVLHMSGTALLLVAPNNSEFYLNFSWHHHSVVTGSLFAFVGWMYATTSTRLFRLFAGNSANYVLFLVLFLAIWTLSLDLPWTSNFLVELQLFRISSSHAMLLPAFMVFF